MEGKAERGEPRPANRSRSFGSTPAYSWSVWDEIVTET